MNMWVAVAENAKGRGKGSARKLIAAALALSATVAHASPTGGQVISGAGSIAQNGATTTITQSTQNLALNWQGFNIASNETVNFVQPSAAAVAINRIFDTNGTQILGHLNANGQIYLINPNGILFGAGAQVNVGGLVASTLDIASSSNGVVSFSGTGTGSVINQGAVNAASSGYVAFIGNKVSNTGTIAVPTGAVALGAGSAVTLTFAGNSLVHIKVDQSTLNNLAENGGLIKADGGMVILTAGAKDALLASVVNNTGIIEAQTVENHDGTITLLGGMTAGTVNVGGTLDVSAPKGGTSAGSAQASGGFIETSAAHVEIANDAKVTTAASGGLSGNWLIDPADFTIAASGGDMSGAAVNAALAGGNLTILSSSGRAGSAGNINVNDTVSWAANTLTLNAQNNIYINNVLNLSNTAGLALKYGQVSANGGSSNYNMNAPVNIATTGRFSTQLGYAGKVVNYTIIDTLGQAGSTTGLDLQGVNGNLSGNYVLGANIDANLTSTWNHIRGSATYRGFTPIGNASTPFTGMFDGLGHSISNLNINLPLLNNVGLFGYTGSTSTIQNVGLFDGSVIGQNYVGDLAGTNNGMISTSYVAGNVTGNNYVGGLVGFNTHPRGAVGGKIINSYATGTVTASGSGSGGLVGYNNGDSISNSYAAGKVSGAGMSGALVGYNSGTVDSSFYNSDANFGLNGMGSGKTTGATGLNAADMMMQANFSGWSFGSTWVIYDGNTAPLLSAFMTPLTVAANDATKTYDGLTYSGGNGVSYSATPNSNLLGTVSYSGNSQGAANAGSYTITPSGLYSNQQGYNISYAAGTLTVNPATLTVTANNASKTYGQTAMFAGTAFTSSGLQNGETIGSVTETSTGSTATATVAGGPYAITPSAATGGTFSASNYTIAYVNGSLTVNPAALTLGGITASNKVYDGTTAATLNTGGITFSGLVSGDSVSLGAAGSGTFVDKNVGIGKTVTVSGYTLGGADAGNYTVAQPSGLTANITPAALSISGITASNKVYDGTASATVSTAGAVYTGLLGTDTVTVSATGTFSDKNVGTNKTVSLTSSYTGADVNNYSIVNQASATANITPAALTLGGITASNKVYDGTTAATLNTGGITFSGLVSGDSVSLGAAGSGTFVDKNVGIGKTVTVSGYTLGGADAGNYTVAQPFGLTANITPATLTYTATPAVFTVGQTPSGLTGAVMGFVGATDNLANSTTGTLAWNTTATASSPQGQYSIDGTGLNATNYNFAQAIGNAAALTLNAVPVTTNLDTLAALLNNHPAPLGLSPTITVLSSSSTGAGGEPTPVVKVKKKVTIDGVGPTLYIVDGGLRVPDADEMMGQE